MLFDEMERQKLVIFMVSEFHQFASTYETKSSLSHVEIQRQMILCKRSYL